MANSLTNVIDTILKIGIQTARENCRMLRNVTVAKDLAPGAKGTSYDVTFPTRRTGQNITGGAKTAGDIKPTKRPVTISHWFGDVAQANDLELMQMQAQQVLLGETAAMFRCITNDMSASLVNAIHAAAYKSSGTTGTCPSQKSDLATLKQIMRKRDPDPASMNNAVLCLNSNAELNLSLLEVLMGKGSEELRTGELGEKYGFKDIFHDQMIDAKTWTGCVAADVLVNGANIAVGATSGTFISAGGATILLGDRFTIAGDTTVYVVTEAVTLAGATAGTIKFWPDCQAIAHVGDAVTFKGDENGVSLAWDRDAVELLVPPIATLEGLGNVRVVTDPVSGISMRGEISRVGWDNLISVDVIYEPVVKAPWEVARMIGA